MVPDYLLGGGNASSNITPGWRIYLGEFEAPQGIHTLYYFSVDSAGNVETMKSSTINSGCEVIVIVPPVSNAELTGISLGDVQYTPIFDVNTLLYTASVGYEVSQVTVTPAAASANAVITVNGNNLMGGSLIVNLGAGANVIQILVTAPDGVTAKTYTFNITRLKQNENASAGGSSPKEINTGKIDIHINGQPQDGMAKLNNTETEGRTMTTVTLSSSRLIKYLENAENNLILSLALKSDSDQAAAEFDGEIIKKLESKSALIAFRPDQAIYTVPAPQIKIEEIARQFGNAPLKDIKVELQIAKPADAVLKAVENAAQNGQFTILAPPIEFKIKCSYLNQTSEVYNFSTPVTRAILIPEGMDKNQISTGIVVETDGRVRHVPTKVVMTGDRLYAQITSLTNSVYALVSRPRQFRDVSGHWAQTSINNMGSRLIINGTGEGLFTPNAAITRAECAAIVINALGLRESDQTSRFSDIERSEWFYGAVTAAYENGLISGYTDGTFQPGKTISREEAMVIILRAINLAGIDTSMADSDIDQEISKFKDGSRFGNWSRQSAAYCIKHQLMLGSQGMAEPERDITRAEAAVIVMKMLQKTNLI